MDLVRASPGAAQNEPGASAGDPNEETVYVEAATAEDLANVIAVTSGGGPLHLTTITVAVPAPLSPSDVLQQHVVTSAPHQVTLPTVPAPQETAVRWKYEQNKQDKHTINSHQTGSSLVSQFSL